MFQLLARPPALVAGTSLTLQGTRIRMSTPRRAAATRSALASLSGRKYRVAQPDVGDAGAPGETDSPVHDKESAVRVVVDRVASGDPQGDDAVARELSAGPDRVQKKPDRDAVSGPFGQGLPEAARDLPRPEDAGLEQVGLDGDSVDSRLPWTAGANAEHQDGSCGRK